MIFAAIAIISALAISDEYECSNEQLSGVVTGFELVRDPKYRSTNMNNAAVVRVSDGTTLHWPSEGINPDEEIKLVRCSSRIFGKVQYRRTL